MHVEGHEVGNLTIIFEERCSCGASHTVEMDYLEDAKQDVAGWREYHEARCPYDLEKLIAAKEERDKQLEALFPGLAAAQADSQ